MKLPHFVRENALFAIGILGAIALWVVIGEKGALNPPTTTAGKTLAEAIDICHGKTPHVVVSHEDDGAVKMYDCTGNGVDLFQAAK